MRPVWGDDYSICCCVSATQTGKEMQFFGARANLAKVPALRHQRRRGRQRPEMQVGPEYRPITCEYLDYDEVMHKYDDMMDWLAGLYVNTLNLIQYMHDKYCYEAAEMALHRHRRAPHLRHRHCRFLPCSRLLMRHQVRQASRPSATRPAWSVDYETEGDFPTLRQR